MKNIFAYIFLLVSPFAFHASAEETSSDRNQGYVSGSFETNTNYYLKDLRTTATVPDGNFGSNNYLKLDYHHSRFTAGIQMEGYAPALVGYSSDLKGVNLTNYYVNWKDDNFSITAGTVYDQFGSGLLFRTWGDSV